MRCLWKGISILMEIGRLPGLSSWDKCVEGLVGLRDLLMAYQMRRIYVGAICAAPSVPWHERNAKERRQLCFPGLKISCRFNSG